MIQNLNPNNDKEKIFYIFINFSKNINTEIEFKFKSTTTQQINYSMEGHNGIFRYNIILKHKFIPQKDSKEIDFSFNNKGEIFKVSFNSEGRIFIFNPNLKIKKNKTSNEKSISQKSISITEKIEFFSKCLIEKKENSKLETLYSDSLDLFNSNPDFELVIYLFIKVCNIEGNYKDICKKLLNLFWDKTSKKESVDQLNNLNECKKFLKEINEIVSNSEKLISKNGLDKTKFYGFILFYLNNYEPSQFKSFSKQIQDQKENENCFFEILIHYSSIFSNDVNICLEKYLDFLLKKDFKTLEKSVIEYFKGIEELIDLINKKKEDLIKVPNFKTFKLPKKPNYDLKELENFINHLKTIIDFSEKKKTLLLFLSGNFWKEITQKLEEPSHDNIYYLFELRKNFKKYYQIVKVLYKKEHSIYKNAEETEEKDEIAIILNRIIQKTIEKEKEISNEDIIKLINDFDIYYKEDIYINRRELNFLDKINFDDKEIEWKNIFKQSNFEEIFNNDIENYILKLVSKINKIEDFEIVIDIINEDKIKKMGKFNYFIELLKKKALNLMKNSDTLKELGTRNDKLSSFTKLLVIIYKSNQQLEKIQHILGKLDNENSHIVFMNLLKSFVDDKNLYEYIFNFYINNINSNYKNINELLEILNEEKIKDFMSKISDKKEEKKNNYRIISYEDFFMEKENLNLILLIELCKKFDLIKNTYYYGETKKVLETVYNNIENKTLKISDLKSLLSSKKEENIIRRFELLTILNKPINPKFKYEELKKKYEEAEKEIKELRKISEAFKVFHKEFYKNEIKQIEEKMDKFNNGEIKEFENISLLIEQLGKKEIKDKVDKINKLKESNFFKTLFDSIQNKNQDEQFELALKNLLNEFKSLNKKTKLDEKTKKREFQIIRDVLGLKGDEKIEKELKYIEDSSDAKEDIKSMIYFFENFKLNNNIEEDLEVDLKKIYETMENDNEKKKNLNILKEKGIYDYENKGNAVEFFNLFNNQKEAIDFLLTKSHENLEIIKDKLISIDNAVNNNDIDEVDNCIDFFNNVLKNSKNKLELFEKIKTININLLANCKTFIKIFNDLVDLDNNSDNSYNLYIKAKKYLSKAIYFISLNQEDYIYTDPKNNKEKIELNVIKSIKYKINFPNGIEIRLKENKQINEGQESNSMEKTELLLKYKEIVSNIELIEQFISVFKKKGCSLPIEIQIKIQYPEVIYYLKKKEISFRELSKYLLNMKNYLEKTLDSNYKSQQNLRFLYGKQFNTLNKHILGNFSMPSFFRYILNNLNHKALIKEGIKSFPRSTYNYVEEYKEYSDDSFQIYNDYISSVLSENGKSIEELYEKMKIISDKKDELSNKGIYLYKSDENSMEEDIVKIFIEKTKNLPIAQNILISNKETSFEEIQAFFHRAFLCRFNTLFVIEINDSLSDYQLKIMNNFISQLLKFQLDKYNKTNSVKIDIKDTNKYIEPLIIFVYNVYKLNESFLKEINKFNPGEYPKINNRISLSDIGSRKSSKKFLSEEVEYKLNNILDSNTHIYSSEICGLGKTEKIKYNIQKDNKEYIYFPLGGKLSRNIIFKKLDKILSRVKDVNNKAAIHLELYETEDISILNEFLFSFCFTKFYSNDNNVLYIPVNVKIYIEIPNCFNSFIKNFPILTYFDMVPIKFNNKEELRLDEEKTKFFNWMIRKEKKNNQLIKQTPEEFINSHIGVEKFSYHQINIFIKLFMNQYKIFNNELIFLDENEQDVTKQSIEEFAKCTKYFTLGIYAKLLTKIMDEENNASLKEDTSRETTSSKNNDINNSISNINFDNKENNSKFSSENGINNSNNSNKIVELKEKTSKEIKDKTITENELLRTNYIEILSKLYDDDLKNEKYEIPLIFIFKEKKIYKKIFLSDEKLKEYKSEENFLNTINYIIQLKNPELNNPNNSSLKSLKEIIDKDNYVITTDNFRKMILIVYRILADVPVILMGETGCGKTGLIRKLYQLLNNGEDMDPKKNMINVDSSINDEKLIEKMDNINKEAKAKSPHDFWVLFDEINTCNSLGLLKEIFINRTYNGKTIEKNIRLIGTCNPYRLKSEKEENCGLSHPYKSKDLVYDVNILPQSLMYFVFNFGALEKNNEDKYIKSILSNHFKDFESGLIEIVTKVISKCHEYLRKLYGPSIVSLREIKRFIKLYENLVEYYKKKEESNLDNNKNEKENDKNKNDEEKKNDDNKNINTNNKNKLNQIKSLIVTTYLSYYIRLIDPEKRTNFESEIKLTLINLSNYYSEKKKKKENKDNNTNKGESQDNDEKQNDFLGDNNKNKGKSQDNDEKQNDFLGDNNKNKGESQDNNEKQNDFLGITWEPLVNEYRNWESENNQNFSIFFENECDFVIDNITLDKGIAKNRILKENIFLLFITITSNIPLIIIGKPGSSKSLSYQLLKKSMRGNYSKSNFFRKYPQILTTYFQGSESTLAEDIDNLFEIGKEKLTKYENNKENKPISLLIFDEIGLSEFAKDNPVKVLHKNLEYDGVKDNLSFVGFSNWKLDSSKLNRVLYLSIPDLDRRIDDLKDTAKCIAESLRKNIDQELLNLLSKSYKSYKEMIKKIKDYVVYKKLEMQEMKQYLDSLPQDKIKKIFSKGKNDINLDDFKKKRNIIEETKKKYSWKYGNFADVKKTDEYKILYAQDRSINVDFHGNRDFYNYIKGVCEINSLSKNISNESSIIQQIEKVIERNFGGLDINLDIDFKLNFNDKNNKMDEINNMVNKYPNSKKDLKIPSVFLFKYIFNEELKKLYVDKTGNSNFDDKNGNSNFQMYNKIPEDNLTKYDLIECINGNINDNDARYLLLEIEEGLKYLVCQHIISQNKGKEIIYLEGSPFINDIEDKNGEYKIKKISEIQNYCNKEMVLILSNLNQIYAFLYDFFNRNFIIKDDKKYCRICQGNFTEQITYIHDKFRIIIMIDKNYVDQQESPFLNRFEKAIVKFEELLNDKEKISSKKIFKNLSLKDKMENININYINNLLKNYNEECIEKMYFYYSNQQLESNEIEATILEKIARTLPQDIIIHLKDNERIKENYKKKGIFNYKDYILYLNKLTKDKKNKFKFSIVYTFTSIMSNIEGINENNSLQIFSEIKRENNLIDLINEKNFQNKKADNNFFIMHFYQHELDKINFIISTLDNNYKDEDIKFIFIVHIKRIMEKKKEEKLYSISDINEKVDQIFIDNLNGLKTSLDDIAKKGIKSILEDNAIVNQKNEFFKALKTYYNTYTDKLILMENYLPKIIKFFKDNEQFLQLILSKAIALINKVNKNNIKDEKMENISSFNQIKSEIFTNSYINQNTVDIVSVIINDIIIENRLRGTIMKVIDALESNNFLTTLLTLDNKKIKLSFSKDKETLYKLMENYLNSIQITEIKNKGTFNTNYLVPGLFSFYENISCFISKNVTEEFYKNEKKLRDCLKGNIIKLVYNFHIVEESLLEKVYKEIMEDESDNSKYINEVINICQSDLLLNDYIYYFLDKNNEKKYMIIEYFSEYCRSDCENVEEEPKEEEEDDFNLKIIKQILDLKYKEETEIIKKNKNNELKKFLIKIIWLEANKNYIFTIIELFNEAKYQIYQNKYRNIFLKQIIDLISDKKIKYITNEDRNPEHTTEVNECYYIILGALYLAITDLNQIILVDPDNYRDYIESEENQVKVTIEIYLKCLKSIVKISQPFNDMLFLFSNELYIIVNLNSILNLLILEKNEYINIQIVEEIIKNLRKNNETIKESKFNQLNELKKNTEDLINLISNNLQNKDKKYYSLLRNILLQEIKKIKDKNYRLDLFKTYIINEKEILLNSNEIFELLLKGYIIPLKEKLLPSLERFESRGDGILVVLENKIKEKKNEYLSQILLYYFEKKSYIYLDNYFRKPEEKNLFEKEPLDVFKKCLDLLSKFTSSKSKIKNVSKLLYIGYIRVFLFKFEEYIRDKSEKLMKPEEVINSINQLENPISFLVKLYYFKVIYNKNNKDLNIFKSKNNLYNLESLNLKESLDLQIKEDNSNNEEEEEEENSFINLLNEKDNELQSLEKEEQFKQYFYFSDYIDEKYLTSIINNFSQDYPVLAKYLELKNNGNLLNDFYIYNSALNLLNEEFSSKITRECANKETLDNQLIYKENKDLFSKFFDIFNKMSGESDKNSEDSDEEIYDDNNINMNLNSTSPLFNFFIVDENKFSEQYKYIYKQFIDKHNEIVNTLLDAKSNILDVQNKDKLNIQNINKEDEIFITKNEFSILDILFDCSYRKVLINDDYSEFNKYEINLEYVEEIMTDKLLKNKKLISNDIFQFKYKNEDLEFKNKNICTKFKENINEEELTLNDKIIIYEYFEENKGNIKLHQKLLDDFATLIIYTCKKIEKKDEISKIKIYKLIEEITFVSDYFKIFFKEKENFTINKLLNIYEYYQILCFNKVKENLEQYQYKITDEKEKKAIKEYIKNDLNINKNNIEIAIRKFILCFLSKEENKESKIKGNINCIKNYLEIEDLWNKEFYKKNEFYEELNKLKHLNIKVNNVIPFYEKCFNNTYKKYFDDVKEELKNREEERRRKEKEKEKEDIHNFNPQDDDIDDDQKDQEENKNEENDGNDNENNLNEDENNEDNGDSYIDEEENDDEDYGGRY